MFGASVSFRLCVNLYCLFFCLFYFSFFIIFIHSGLLFSPFYFIRVFHVLSDFIFNCSNSVLGDQEKITYYTLLGGFNVRVYVCLFGI